MIAARHPQISEYELGEEGEVKANKDDARRQPSPTFGIHSATDFRPPIMDGAEIRHYGGSHHDVVEVGYHEVGVSDMHIHAQSGDEESGETSHGEQPDKAKAVEHGRLI